MTGSGACDEVLSVKNILIPIITVLLTASSAFAEDAKLSIDERRYRAELKDKTLPEIQAKIQETTGTAVEVVVDWDSFTSGESLNMLGYTIKDLAPAMETIARDDIGKEAVANGLKTVRLVNKDAAADWTNTGTVEDKVFAIEWNFGAGSYISQSMMETRLNEKL